MFKKHKKGELTTTQIVGLIILVLSFVVIFIFISRLSLQSDSKKEICRTSVVLAGRDPLNKNINCETNYVCITNGEECKDISPDKTIKVNPGNDEKRQILKAIADELSDCWMMFGEGNIKYVPNSVTGSFSYHCAICSIIKFGDSTINVPSKDELILYLNSEKKDSNQTYSKYLYGVDTLTDPPEQFMYNFKDMDKTKKYAIITGINPDIETFDLQKSDSVYPSIIAVDEISSTKGVCGLFDITYG